MAWNMWPHGIQFSIHHTQTKHIWIISKIVENFQEIPEILQKYPGYKLTFLEIPYYSIYKWNKSHNLNQSRPCPDVRPDWNHYLILFSILCLSIYFPLLSVRTIGVSSFSPVGGSNLLPIYFNSLCSVIYLLLIQAFILKVNHKYVIQIVISL
jgi:hypothetical protein